MVCAVSGPHQSDSLGCGTARCSNARSPARALLATRWRISRGGVRLRFVLVVAVVLDRADEEDEQDDDNQAEGEGLTGPAQDLRDHVPTGGEGVAEAEIDRRPDADPEQIGEEEGAARVPAVPAMMLIIALSGENGKRERTTAYLP